jgi:hypothetical protein
LKIDDEIELGRSEIGSSTFDLLEGALLGYRTKPTR